MKIELKKYNEQIVEWPDKGHHIMAQYDDKEIIVYQSYRKEIGEFAVKNQFFGGEFSLTRMTWIKPNFLWMMYRNGWGTKEGQEIVLAIHLKIEAFQKYLQNAVYSSYDTSFELSYEEWKSEVKTSSVRLQWDPDHNPYGEKLERRAVQIGLRDDFIKSFAKEDILKIEDISEFVKEQYEFVQNRQLENLVVPFEKPFLFADEVLNRKLKIS
ncbi:MULTISPECIES: DUF4291 domain-containing protein [Flavobacterium]|uniref:DUF4291 domain-containing protein n=1 Tax=Flavobacterium cupriresistens TaxID=2893885 RepID=A0ABU4RG22_9FLAO|nr:MULTISPECIES: DUF4291 domain-containing protein [unclassified Flavobacterium]KLT69531.1 hypothetical protein AB674_11310 [Flavobacterium sp. ABG]MDX6191542.1 DUF4291 domain-containing protein [Flavobacterium sp. Fl-318]UFH43306.1 DUF4291 domain-containing protein [Flavobacterium sp. F-323]